MNKHVKQSAMFSERPRMRSACFNRMMQYSVPVSNVSSSDYVTVPTRDRKFKSDLEIRPRTWLTYN